MLAIDTKTSLSEWVVYMTHDTTTYPFMSKRLFGGRSTGGVDCETFGDKGASGVGNIGPIFCWLKCIITGNDGFHLLLLSIAVEWSIPCIKMVDDDH